MYMYMSNQFDYGSFDLYFRRLISGSYNGQEPYHKYTHIGRLSFNKGQLWH